MVGGGGGGGGGGAPFDLITTTRYIRTRRQPNGDVALDVTTRLARARVTNAMRTNDELSSVAELRGRGVDFLTIPDTYYDIVWDRVNETLKANGHEAVKEDHDRIKELGILVDADDEGYLLQLFTKPLQDRPTLFFEIICRRGSQSFGKGNFKALFESLEIEQDRRGNL